MGLTPVDLFNDILTSEIDLRNFLDQNDVQKLSASQPGLVIKAYLAFVQQTKADVFSPVSNTEIDQSVAVFNEGPKSNVETEEIEMIDCGRSAAEIQPSSSKKFIPCQASARYFPVFWSRKFSI